MHSLISKTGLRRSLHSLTHLHQKCACCFKSKITLTTSLFEANHQLAPSLVLKLYYRIHWDKKSIAASKAMDDASSFCFWAWIVIINHCFPYSPIVDWFFIPKYWLVNIEPIAMCQLNHSLVRGCDQLEVEVPVTTVDCVPGFEWLPDAILISLALMIFCCGLWLCSLSKPE